MALSDHTRRDAEAYSRALIAQELGRYRRRMEELAKGVIKTQIEEATKNERAIDGFTVGKAAADSAVHAYFTPGEPQAAIEAPSKPDELGSGSPDAAESDSSTKSEGPFDWSI